MNSISRRSVGLVTAGVLFFTGLGTGVSNAVELPIGNGVSAEQSSAAIVDVTMSNIEQLKKKSNQHPVFFLVTAPAWCGSCRTMDPVIRKMAQEAQGKWTLAVIDVDRSDAKRAFKVRGYPSIVPMTKGYEGSHLTGFPGEGGLKSFIDKNVSAFDLMRPGAPDQGDKPGGQKPGEQKPGEQKPGEQKPDGQKPVKPDQQKPVKPEGQQPVKPDEQKPVKPEGQQPVKPDQQKPVKPEGQQPVKPDEQKPVKPEGQQPVKPDEQKPVKPEGQQPVKPDQQKPVKPEGQQPVKPDEQKPVKPEGQQPVKPVPGKVVEVTDKNFDSLLAGSKKTPLILDFSKDGCQPCQQLTPVLEAKAKAANGAIVIGRLDGTKYPKLWERFDRPWFPTLISIIDGKETARRSGYDGDKAAVSSWIDRAAKGSKGIADPTVVKVTTQDSWDKVVAMSKRHPVALRLHLDDYSMLSSRHGKLASSLAKAGGGKWTLANVEASDFAVRSMLDKSGVNVGRGLPSMAVLYNGKLQSAVPSLEGPVTKQAMEGWVNKMVSTKYPTK